MSRKGVTPLISSLLLIFFAIVLGVLVMSWGKTQQQHGAEIPKSCERAALRVISVGNELQSCYKDDKIYFTLENNGESELIGLRYSVIGSMEIYQNEIELKMGASDIKKLDVKYGKDIGNIMQLRLTPMISSSKLCPNNVFEASNIKECG